LLTTLTEVAKDLHITQVIVTIQSLFQEHMMGFFISFFLEILSLFGFEDILHELPPGLLKLRLSSRGFPRLWVTYNV
jgi:hypothetical protein